jgi:hypothetical protein
LQSPKKRKEKDMERNRIIRIIVAVLVVAAVVAFVIYKNHKKNNEPVNPNLSIAAYNQTQNIDATKSTAHSKDVIIYTLNAANPNDKVISGYVMSVSIGGLTGASTLIDAQGANYNSGNNSLVWTPLDIPSNGAIQKQFTVRVNDTLPANASDRVLKVTFNNELDVNVDNNAVATNHTARPGSVGGSGAYKAPTTGIPGWISFYLALFLTFGIMLFRTARRLGTPRN